MKAIVLGGGYAKRLWPLTQEQAKPLVEINGRPIIAHIIDKLEASGHVDEIIISTNAKFREDFERWLNSQRFKKPVRLAVEKTNHEGEKLGAVGGIRYVLLSESIEDEVLVIGGDNLISVDIDEMARYFAERRRTVVAVYDIKNKDEVRRFGEVMVGAGGKITRLREKPQHPETTIVSTCCYMFTQGIREEIEKYMEEGGNRDAPGFFIDWLSRKQEVFAYVFDSYWFDIGDHSMLEKAREFAKKNL